MTKRVLQHDVQLQHVPHRAMLPVTLRPGDKLTLTYTIDMDHRLLRKMPRQDFIAYIREMAQDKAIEVYDSITLL